MAAFCHTITHIPHAHLWGALVGPCQRCQERALFECSFKVLRPRGSRQQTIHYSKHLCETHATEFAYRHSVEIPPLPQSVFQNTVVDMGMPKRKPTEKLIRKDRYMGGPSRPLVVRFKLPERRRLDIEAKAKGVDLSSYVRHLLDTHPTRR